MPSTSCAQNWRRRRREELEARGAVPGPNDVEQEFWDLATAEVVREALGSLQPAERSAIELAYFEGHTYREVATILGQPEGTVKSRNPFGHAPDAELAGSQGNGPRERPARRGGTLMAVLDHEEVAEMLATYSLDALPPDEAALVEQHLADCPRCRAELASLQEVAALLAGSDTAAPDGLWDRIASELSGPAPGAGPPAAPPAAPVLRPIGGARRPRAWRAATVGLVAVLLAVLGVLSYRVVNLDNRVGQLQSALSQHGPSQQVALALADPAHHRIQLTAKGSTVTATVVVLPDGRAYWVDDDLAALPAGRTYQLWALSSGKVVSLGVLGRSPQNVPFRVERTMSQLMVTAEPTGGVPAPTTPVVVAGPVPL